MHHSLRDIISKGKSAIATHSQRQEFLSQFHRPDIEFELKDYLLEDLNKTEDSTINKLFFDELFEKLWRKRKIEISPAKLKNRFAVRVSKWAAILVIGLLLGYYVNSVQNNSAPVYYTLLAPKGSVSEMYLPDGSHIFLNSGSEIKYTVDGTNGMREVFLNGEAWFHVAKIKEKPFLVHTPFYDVKVTGTSFNVKSYSNEKNAVTTLEEGRVQIMSSKNLKLPEEIILKPGEQLNYNDESKKIQIADVNTKLITSWRDNKLVFINMSLKDLRILLERKYGVEIEIVDQSILNYHYDGTIKSETIIEVLEILKHTLPIKYKVIGQKIVIQKK